ncbi:MAG: hypothetical protein AB3N12_01485 [Ruegeria sp.]
MTAETYAILCGNCSSELKGSHDPSPDDLITCPGCQQSDRYEEVQKSVLSHAKETAAVAMNKRMRQTASRSRLITVSGGITKVRPHRWISTIKL